MRFTKDEVADDIGRLFPFDQEVALFFAAAYEAVEHGGGPGAKELADGFSQAGIDHIIRCYGTDQLMDVSFNPRALTAGLTPCAWLVRMAQGFVDLESRTAIGIHVLAELAGVHVSTVRKGVKAKLLMRHGSAVGCVRAREWLWGRLWLVKEPPAVGSRFD